MRRWPPKTTVLVIALAASVLAAGARAEPVEFRAGWVTTPASLVPVLFAKQGLAKHLGKSYVFEPIYINASPRQITAIAAGELDIAALGFSSFPFAIANAGLTDLRIIIAVHLLQRLTYCSSSRSWPRDRASWYRPNRKIT